MHVLVTRPEADARQMKARIEALGCRVSTAPLIEIVHEPIAANAFDGAAGLIATSRNAIAALSASPALKAAIALPIFIVGAATAQRAREAGFQNVITGPGTAAGLASIIASHASSKTGPLIHFAGDHLAVDLAGLTAAADVQVQTIVAYRSVATKILDPSVARDLETGAIDAVVLMSPRTARAWRGLTRASDVTALTHVCLSQAVAKTLMDDGGSAKIEIATAPTTEEILAVIERLASHSSAE